jgi:pimeloyl-ACP methyl ester carboxylesterase
VDRGAWAIVLAVGIAAPASATAQLAASGAVASDDWRDTTHHTAGFVRVQRGVRLHYLDFGGPAGAPTIVMLAGLGNTAHAFDDFAPALTGRFHVVAITRRGFGESDHPQGGYDTRRLVEDVRAVMDSLRIAHATLIGHSIAGEELTRFAAKYPRRVDKLVYLDAAYDRVAAEEAFDRVFPVAPNVPSPPVPEDSDIATPAAYVAFVHRTRGVNIPESDIRTRYRYDGWDEETTHAYQAIHVERPDYRDVRAPALAIYAVADSVSQLEPWQRSDTLHAAGLRTLIRGTEYVERGIRAEFQHGVANNQILVIHGGHHWVFVSNRDEVLGAVREFLK